MCVAGIEYNGNIILNEMSRIHRTRARTEINVSLIFRLIDSNKLATYIHFEYPFNCFWSLSPAGTRIQHEPIGHDVAASDTQGLEPKLVCVIAHEGNGPIIRNSIRSKQSVRSAEWSTKCGCQIHKKDQPPQEFAAPHNLLLNP